MLPINFKNKKVPSWSWTAFSGKTQYGHKRGWHQGATLETNVKSDTRKRQIRAPIVRILQDYALGPNEKLISNGHLVGWVRFDQDDKHDVKNLRCIVIGQGTTGWKDFTGVSWVEDLPPGVFYYVLLVPPAKQEQGAEQVYQRRGVAVIQGEYLSFSGPSPGVAVIWIYLSEGRGSKDYTELSYTYDVPGDIYLDILPPVYKE